MRDIESFDSSCSKKNQQKRVILTECKTALSPSNLPGLDFALNPYFGCSHSCIYCYAPYVLHQPKGDWGGTVSVKRNIPKVVSSEATKKNGVIGIGTVTDPYQDAEAQFMLTRKCLESLLKVQASVSILTKSPLVTRDSDLIARFKSAEVGVTITTQFDDLASQFEPGAPPPSKRLEAVRDLVEAGIDTYVLIGPVLPGVSDKDLEGFLEIIGSTGARRIIIDKLRLRPGMLLKIRSIPMMQDEDRWNEFCENAQSYDYYRDLSERMNALCTKFKIRCVQAF